MRILSLSLSLTHSHTASPRGSHFLSISEVLSALSFYRTHFASSTTIRTRIRTNTAITEFLYCCSNTQCPRGTSGSPADCPHAHRSSHLFGLVRRRSSRSLTPSASCGTLAHPLVPDPRSRRSQIDYAPSASLFYAHCTFIDASANSLISRPLSDSHRSHSVLQYSCNSAHAE